jgi:hypothetical protein
VRQPVQRIIDALRGERRERQRLARPVLECAIDDPIVRVGKVRHVKYVAQRPRECVRRRRVQMRAFQQREMQRDRRRGLGDNDRHVVIFQQQPYLLIQIGLE